MRIGIAIPLSMGLAITNQYLNRYLTKKRTGIDNFVGENGYETNVKERNEKKSEKSIKSINLLRKQLEYSINSNEEKNKDIKDNKITNFNQNNKVNNTSNQENKKSEKGDDINILYEINHDCVVHHGYEKENEKKSQQDNNEMLESGLLMNDTCKKEEINFNRNLKNEELKNNERTDSKNIETNNLIFDSDEQLNKLTIEEKNNIEKSNSKNENINLKSHEELKESFNPNDEYKFERLLFLYDTSNFIFVTSVPVLFTINIYIVVLYKLSATKMVS